MFSTLSPCIRCGSEDAEICDVNEERKVLMCSDCPDAHKWSWNEVTGHYCVYCDVAEYEDGTILCSERCH